jgi:hypothetical protein
MRRLIHREKVARVLCSVQHEYMLVFLGINFYMKNMSPMPTLSIALRIKAGRIPVRWEVRESRLAEIRDDKGKVLSKAKRERVFCPQVEATKWGDDVEVGEIEDPIDKRAELFRLFNGDRTEGAALKFLNSIGAWRIVDGDPALRSSYRGTFANIAFGHRYALGVRVLETTLDEMLGDIERWRKLINALRNPARLKAHYKEPPAIDARPADHFSFAVESSVTNTLPVSLEWSGKYPHAVIETLSAWELMSAAAWADVVGGLKLQVCAECKTPFTSPRKKKHCLWECGHRAAVRGYKQREAAKKKSKALRKGVGR